MTQIPHTYGNAMALGHHNGMFDIPLLNTAPNHNTHHQQQSTVRVTVGASPVPGCDAVTRIHEATRVGESRFSGFVSHLLRDKHFDPRGYDLALLPMCLTTFLGYLYTRNWAVVLVAQVVYCLWERLVWSLLLPLCSPAIARHVAAVETHDAESLLDVVLLLLALLTSMYALDYTVLGDGIDPRLVAHFPTTGWDWAAVGVLALVSCVSAFPDLFYRSALVTLLAIGTLALVYWNTLQTWNALIATLATLWFYAWFLWPVAYYHAYNAFFALLTAVFILSLLTGVKSI